MTGRRTIVMIQLGLALLLPTTSQGNDLSRTGRPQTIRILIEDRVERQIVTRVLSELFQTALQYGLDVNVRATGSLGAPDWSPSKPLSLSDLKRDSLATKVFGSSDDSELTSERSSRFELAVKQMDEYFARYGGHGSGCAVLLPIAQQIANEDFPLNVVVLGGAICSSPRVTVKLPPNRRLVVLLASENAPDDNPCAAIEQERRLRAAFPKAVVTPLVDSSTLSRVLLNGSDGLGSQLVVRSCDDRKKPKETQTIASSSQEVPPTDSPNKRLHVISPRQGAKVARLVPFQGEGAAPREQVFPVVCVGDECFPQQPVTADDKGNFDGVIIIGRPANDCGQRYEFRLFAQLRQELTVGRVIGTWPKAGASSLSVDLIRAEECGAGD